MRLNYYLAKGTLVGALGGLLFGFDTAVISGTTQQLTNVFHLSPSNSASPSPSPSSALSSEPSLPASWARRSARVRH